MTPQRGQEGQVTVLVLGFALVCFAVAGLAVDGTRAFLLRRTLQSKADAAALAGASEIDVVEYYETGGESVVLEPTAARTVAEQWLAERPVHTSSEVEVTPEGIAIVMRGYVRASFLSLVGIDRVDVAVQARAEPVAGSP
ncbi:MAG: pilus assembly protein TadG-related protein [Actinomycetota bacterium]